MTDTAKEYATALFALSKENDSETEYYNGVEYIKEVFKANQEYIEFLATPNIPKEERTAALQKLFEAEVPELVLNFVQLICEKGHIRSYSDIAKEYMLLYLAYKDISYADITSAAELDDEQKSELQKKLEKLSGNKVVMEFTVDRSLLGGVIVRMDGTVLDGSLKSRLEDVKEVLDK